VIMDFDLSEMVFKFEYFLSVSQFTFGSFAYCSDVNGKAPNLYLDIDVWEKITNDEEKKILVVNIKNKNPLEKLKSIV